MDWSEDLASTAQEWANNCIFQHSGAPDLGENIYVASWEAQADEVVDSWASEVVSYNYEDNSCLAVCGHYTQVVWRESVHVGCAYADCDGNLLGASGMTSGRLWVCNYSPPGNWVGQWPY